MISEQAFFNNEQPSYQDLSGILICEKPNQKKTNVTSINVLKIDSQESLQRFQMQPNQIKQNYYKMVRHKHRHCDVKMGTGCCIKHWGAFMEIQAEAIFEFKNPPTVRGGLLIMTGSQQKIMALMNERIANPEALMYQPQPQLYPSPSTYLPPPQFPQEVQMTNMAPTPTALLQQQAFAVDVSITVSGVRTARNDSCLFTLVSLLGFCLFFPLLFFCCHCFIKKTYPRHELSIEFYQLLAAFIKKQAQCKVFRLTVIDNAFNAAKAKLIAQALSGTGVISFNFINKAFPCNYLGQQADQFKENVNPIKALPITSMMAWGQMRL